MAIEMKMMRNIAGIVLAEHFNVSVDLLKVIKMVLIHDIVEIDAGDTFI